MMNLENRINELESRLAFQDDTIQCLNDAIVKQQELIDLLERKIASLIKGHNDLLEQWQAVEDNVPPPHY